MSLPQVTDLVSALDIHGKPVRVSLGTFRDSKDIEGMVSIGGNEAVFDPSEDDSLAELRHLIEALQEIERAGLASR